MMQWARKCYRPLLKPVLSSRRQVLTMPKLRTHNAKRLALTFILCGGVLGGCLASPTWGGEPAASFVSQLRNAGYYDSVIKYLDRIDKYPGVDASFKEAIPLEKAQTFIDAAVAARSIAERDGLFVSAESELKSFLSLTSHPRFSEARLQLGKLQLVRANQLMGVADPDDQARENARTSCLEAAATFEAIVKDLRSTLEGMKGQRIDPAKEPDKAAQRDQYRFEFLQAQVRSGEAKQLAAQTYREPAKDGKKLLEEALVSFTELSDKYGSYMQGATAMLYRAQVQRVLGDAKGAIDSFQRVLEQPEVEPLRPMRLQGMTGLIELRLAETPPKLDEMIAQAKPLVDGSRPNERRTPEFAAFQVALAKVYLAQSEKLIADGKQADGRRAASSNARPLLAAAAKVPGLHETEAKELLAKLGVEPVAAEAAPVVTRPKSLEEALTAARELLQENEELTRARQVLVDQVAQGGEGAEQAKTELATVDERIAESRNILIQQLRGGLSFGGAEREPLNQARQYLTYVLYQRGDFWDAAVVGQFLARSAANKPEGLRGGLMALASYQNLMRDLPKESLPSMVRQIEVLGNHLTRTWPDDPQAASAKGILIRLALDDDRWDDAKKLLLEIPAGAERASYQRLMGQLLWNQFLMLRQQNKVQESDAVLPQAADQLKAGLDGIPGELAGAEALQAALVLAKIEVRRGDANAAIQVLDHPKYGPVKAVEKLGEPSEGFLSDLYAAELQAVVGVMTTDGSDTQKLLTRATAVMDQLQGSVEGKADAGDRLVRIYIGMARDIKDQLDAADPDRKAKLIGAFRVFLDSIAKSSKDPATLQWVGQTLIQMGEASMAPEAIRAEGQAKELLASSIQTFESLRTQLGAATPATLQFQLGRAYRLSGEYKKAIDVFVEILSKTPMMLDTQIEAAKAYEQWAAVIGPQFASQAYNSALNGAKPGADGKTNLIWGWGRISKMVSGRPEFRDQFFDARYHVALARFKMGKASNNTKIMEQAISDITQVAALYPDLGGEQQRKDFDLLMKEIQKALGKNPVGLPAPA